MGVGIVIVKVWGSPIQLFEIGVTVMVAINALSVLLVTGKEKIFPVALPLAAKLWIYCC